MKYEVVNLDEKTVVGISARTSNASPDMGMIIGGLWTNFYQNGIYNNIQHKINSKSLGIYTDYAGTEKGEYSIIVACEVSHVKEVPQETSSRIIPAGKYAKFIVKGNMHQAVADFWAKLWTMDLPRSFECDFEEYQNSDMENAEIHIYIGLLE